MANTDLWYTAAAPLKLVCHLFEHQSLAQSWTYMHFGFMWEATGSQKQMLLPYKLNIFMLQHWILEVRLE